MVGGSHDKFSEKEGRAKRGIRLFRAHGLFELGKIASGFATQGLWLGNRKVRSPVVGVD